MSPHRRSRSFTASILAAACVAAPLSSAAVAAEPYPTRPIRIVVAFSAGGVIDTVTRMVGTRLEETFGQPVIVENRPGASGNIASEAVAKAAPDGYTLLAAANPVTVLPSTHGARAVDPVRAFAPITKLATQPILIAINPALRVDSVSDLIALGKRSPERLAYATAGVGTTDHLAAAMLWTRAGVEALHVPYTNTGQEIKDLLAGEIRISFIVLGTVAPYLRSGQLKALAVTGMRRVAAIPDVPTVAESGFSGFEATSWSGLLAPAGTPKDIIDTLHREVARILQLPDVRDKLVAMGMEPVGNTPEQFADEIKALVKFWPPVVKAAGIPTE
jgi:tripartite-type tricarboxylate transporter receptor subunit TctC